LSFYTCFFLLLVFLIGFVPAQTIHWQAQLYAFLVGIGSFISFKLMKRFSVAMGLLYLMSVLIGLFIYFFMPLTAYANYPLSLQAGMAAQLMLAVVYSTFFAIFFLLIKNREKNLILKSLLLVVLLDPVFMFFNDHYWVMGNHSVDASFLACMIPLLVKEKFPLPVIGLILIEILLTKSVTAMSAVALGLVIFGLLYYGKRSLTLTIPTVLIGFGLCDLFMIHFHGSGIIASSNSILQDHGRFYTWHECFEYYWGHFQPWFGTGIGTYWTWGTLVQLANKQRDIFYWLHNDWLQIFFEYGIIGFSLVVWVYGVALYRLKKRPLLFTSFSLFGYSAFTQMPLRQPLFALLGGYLLFEAYEPRS
jgi:O-antigen ligase